MRRRGLAATTAGGLLAMTALPAAFAEDLPDKKDRGESRHGRPTRGESSAEPQTATDALIRAQNDLLRAALIWKSRSSSCGRSMVVSTCAQGDRAMMGLSMVFAMQDPAALAGNVDTTSTLVNVELTTLDQLEAAKVMLQDKEDEMEAAKQEVAENRRGAAENLRIKEALELQARQAEA